MSVEEPEAESTGENLWAVLDPEENVIKAGFESEEAASNWTTTDEGKKE